MISISLFHCRKKVFTRLNIWVIGKNTLKFYYLKKKKDFYSHLSMEVITDVDYITCTQKEFVNNLKSEISGIIMIYFLKAIHYC